jgi:hypothetical protein
MAESLVKMKERLATVEAERKKNRTQGVNRDLKLADKLLKEARSLLTKIENFEKKEAEGPLK